MCVRCYTPPICVNVSERRGRLCVLKSVERGHIGTLAHSSFRWRGLRIFNTLPPKIRNLSNCDVLLFKRQLDNYLSILPDVPCTPNTVTWSIVLRCDDHTCIFTCVGCARDPYFYVPVETQSYVIKLSCSRKVFAACGD